MTLGGEPIQTQPDERFQAADLQGSSIEEAKHAQPFLGSTPDQQNRFGCTIPRMPSPRFSAGEGQWQADLMTHVTRTQELFASSLENKEKIWEATLQRLCQKVLDLEAAQAKNDQRMSEFGGRLRGLTEEVQNQIRRQEHSEAQVIDTLSRYKATTFANSGEALRQNFNYAEGNCHTRPQHQDEAFARAINEIEVRLCGIERICTDNLQAVPEYPENENMLDDEEQESDLAADRIGMLIEQLQQIVPRVLDHEQTLATISNQLGQMMEQGKSDKRRLSVLSSARGDFECRLTEMQERQEVLARSKSDLESNLLAIQERQQALLSKVQSAADELEIDGSVRGRATTPRATTPRATTPRANGQITSRAMSVLQSAPAAPQVTQAAPMLPITKANPAEAAGQAQRAVQQSGSQNPLALPTFPTGAPPPTVIAPKEEPQESTNATAKSQPGGVHGGNGEESTSRSNTRPQEPAKTPAGPAREKYTQVDPAMEEEARAILQRIISSTAVLKDTQAQLQGKIDNINTALNPDQKKEEKKPAPAEKPKDPTPWTDAQLRELLGNQALMQQFTLVMNRVNENEVKNTVLQDKVDGHMSELKGLVGKMSDVLLVERATAQKAAFDGSPACSSTRAGSPFSADVSPQACGDQLDLIRKRIVDQQAACRTAEDRLDGRKNHIENLLDSFQRLPLQQ